MVAHDDQEACERNSQFLITRIAMKSIKLIGKYYLQQLNVTTMENVPLYIYFVPFTSSKLNF